MTAPSHALFESLTPDERVVLDEALVPVSLAAGERLIAQYDTSDALYLLAEGTVVVEADGSELARLSAGAVLGEVGLFTQAVRTASVRTATPALLHRLSRDAFDRLRASDHPVAHRIERRTIRQLRDRMEVPVASLHALAATTRSLRRSLPPEPAPGVEVPLGTSALTALLATAATLSTSDRRGQRRLAPNATVRVFQPGESITELDAPSCHLLLAGVVDGWADVGPRPDKVRVTHVAAGHLFGMAHLLPEAHLPLHFIATEPSTVVTFDPARISGLFASDTAAGSVLRQALLASLIGQQGSAQEIHAEAVLRATLDPDAPERAPREREPGTDHWDAWFDL